ncbi:MAG: MBL fold metallo-hydrolase [Sulfurimonas sp.]|nr:MBL fold metallo-hydrolase [Sulfurimonas sp.]
MKSTAITLGVATALFFTACNTTKTDVKKEVLQIKTDKTQKESTSFTKKKNDALKSYLPFEDRTDFENANKGFIATLDSGEIKDENGEVVYSMKQFDFIKDEAPSTTNPSLWRQSKLNSINGLFKVTDRVYQVRGFDLSNISFIEGDTGWIVIDPLVSAETAKASLDLINKELGFRPVSAIIFTHSHIDHFGGIRGVVDVADIESGKVKLYGPKGLFDDAVNENIMAGNAMGRRSTYMYGNLLKKDAKGMIGSGLGQTLSTGKAGIIDPTIIISSETGITKVVDGLNVEFVYTPEAEAPSEMIFYFTDLKTFCQAEIITHNFHNLYTLRGAKVRNGQKWSSYIDLALVKWGDDMEVSFGSHHWPTWGNKEITKFLEKARGLYRFTHDQTLRLANHGYTPKEISEMLKLPESLDKTFANRDYYGTMSHNIKAEYELYFGWFDGNPANLNPLPPVESGKKYVEFMGGADAVLLNAKKSYDKGEYRWVGEVLNKLVFAEPKNQDAKNLLADAYEQLAYQTESGAWRNYYLTAVKELRTGVKVLPSTDMSGPDMVRGMSLDLYLNYIAMRFIGTDKEAQEMKYNFNIILPDVAERGSLIIEDGVVTPRVDSLISEDVTATITLNRSDLDKTSLGEATFEELMKSGAIKVSGDKEAFNKFLTKIDKFKFWFNIVEP